jgi:hypothetical protein
VSRRSSAGFILEIDLSQRLRVAAGHNLRDRRVLVMDATPLVPLHACASERAGNILEAPLPLLRHGLPAHPALRSEWQNRAVISAPPGLIRLSPDPSLAGE